MAIEGAWMPQSYGGEGLPRQVNSQISEQLRTIECVLDRGRSGKDMDLLYLAHCIH